MSIDLRESEQELFYRSFEPVYEDVPFVRLPEKDHIYWYENDWFSYADALSLALIFRPYRPKHVCEIGCGYSSRAMRELDRWLALHADYLIIDPDVHRFIDCLDGMLDDRRVQESVVPTGLTIRQSRLENIPGLDDVIVKMLAPGDVLFIDSSHVFAPGSDVQILFSRVLPRLATGVVVHIHDVFWPFEYPKRWGDCRSYIPHLGIQLPWNEINAVELMLSFSTRYKILLFNHWAVTQHPEWFERMPLFKENPGGSLWLEIA